MMSVSSRRESAVSICIVHMCVKISKATTERVSLKYLLRDSIQIGNETRSPPPLLSVRVHLKYMHTENWDSSKLNRFFKAVIIFQKRRPNPESC